MIKDHFLEILALDWMIDKPLTTDKKKPNKPIEDKHLTTWCSWRQIRILLTKFSLCCQKRHTSVKAATCLHKMGKNIIIPCFFANLSEGNGVEVSQDFSSKELT